MEQLSSIGIGFWEALKIIFSIIWKHLPHFMLMLVAGLGLGLLLAFFISRFCSRRGVFKRPNRKKSYRILTQYFYPSIFFLSILFLVINLFTWLATGNIVEKEVHHGVEVSFDFVENHYLKDESVRQDLYKKAEVLLKGGNTLKNVNQAIGEAAILTAAEHRDANFIVRNFSGLIGTSFIEEKLLEYEKGILFYISALAIDHMGMDVEDIYSYEVFEKGFDAWYNLKWASESVGIKDSISGLIYNYISPVILGIFLPFMLVFFGLILIPLIDFGIYSRKLRRNSPLQLEE